ncbi:unnamed protein product [Owenia fusiformis]|uniref:Nesprin-1 spectrin repeats region domain-containing protein n=1 Tax=Owenia fusiformis TaxID=6347 RepID=A0A8S4Q8P3_OWEFU|nr:unnamed protein product [Owenia fusiformis]
MVVVLGPVATEPSMVKTQLQQVEVLQDELNSQQPQYEHFIQVGHSILDKCDPNSEDAKAISKQLDDMNKSWDKVQAKLNDRQESLKTVLGSSTDFYDVLEKLADWIPDIMDKMMDQEPVSSQPAELEAQRADLERMEEELCETTKESSAKFDLKSKLSNVERPFNDLVKKIDARKKEIKGAVKEVRRFDETCTEMLDWIADQQFKLDNQEPISGKADKLKEQVRLQEGLQNDLSSKEGEFQSLLKKATSLIDLASDGSDTTPIQDKQKMLKAEWDKLQKAAAERKEKLKECNKAVDKYQADHDHLVHWLEFNEEKLNNMDPVGLTKDVLLKQLKEAQGLIMISTERV